jgi:hypothetical protein
MIRIYLDQNREDRLSAVSTVMYTYVHSDSMKFVEFLYELKISRVLKNDSAPWRHFTSLYYYCYSIHLFVTCTVYSTCVCNVIYCHSLY